MKLTLHILGNLAFNRQNFSLNKSRTLEFVAKKAENIIY